MITTYKLAVTEQDRDLLYKKLAEWEHPNPTRELGEFNLMAFRNEDFIGFIGLQPFKGGTVVINRIAIDPALPRQSRSIHFLRLAEAFEEQLRRMGMKWYHVMVDIDNPILKDMIERVLSIKPYHQDDKLFWFKRELV